MKVGDKVILVNVNSAAKRLLLSKTEIKEAAQADNLHQLFLTSEKQANEIIKNYEEIVVGYHSNKELLETDKIKTGLSRNHVIKVISFIVRNLHLMQDESAKIVKMRTSKKDREFIIQKEGENLNISLISKLLGAGGFGKAKYLCATSC